MGARPVKIDPGASSIPSPVPFHLHPSPATLIPAFSIFPLCQFFVQWQQSNETVGENWWNFIRMKIEKIYELTILQPGYVVQS